MGLLVFRGPVNAGLSRGEIPRRPDAANQEDQSGRFIGGPVPLGVHGFEAVVGVASNFGLRVPFRVRVRFSKGAVGTLS